jgi:uncharacterized protein with HEPN domain
MTERDKKYLSDILIAIDFIEDFLKGVNSFEKYSSDSKTKSAVERQLAIIGEAVNIFLKLSADNSLQNSKQIVRFRNHLVHAYDSIDDNIVWVIINNHLHPLKVEIINKLSD